MQIIGLLKQRPWATAVFLVFILSGQLQAQTTADYAQDRPRAAQSFTGFNKTAGTLPFLSPHGQPILVADGLVFVANTPNGTVDILASESRNLLEQVPVGVEPVSLAMRPDGRELWVSNHVSDSVSIIDTDPTSSTHLQVVDVVQDLDPSSGKTRFDEPVGVAFASVDKAYVALSSQNRVAIIDVAERAVIGHLSIESQDPRVLFVRGDRLFVIPFESNNKTQISGGNGPRDGSLVTFNAAANVDNVLSTGIVVDIVKHPDMPDRDLYVFDTETDQRITVVDGLGTLLYGMTVDSQGRVFITQADARNDANGKAGTAGHGLAEMENRAFLNRITRLDLGFGLSGQRTFFELEPLPPNHPDPHMALATPYAIALSRDERFLVVSAAGSNQVFSVDANHGSVLDRVSVAAGPRGVAMETLTSGSRAWVLNALANSVSIISVGQAGQLQLLDTLPLTDPTPATFKRGRILFNDARLSSTGTFSCASCHPDGHTDQLLWVLDTPITSRGTQVQPRITMPARGLRDTMPFHWDGIPGDPYGGRNSANVFGSVPPNSDIGDQVSSTRDLVDGSLASTMRAEGDEQRNDEGKLGPLSAPERDDLARFLLGIPYPPAPDRAVDNVLSDRAREGFQVFHVDGIFFNGGRNVCGDCHRMPFWVSTNTPGTGMDAPTWRGAYDRWLVLPQGRWNIVDVLGTSVKARGIPERNMWVARGGDGADRSPLAPVWHMVTEGSTGFSGAFARQVALDMRRANQAYTATLLKHLTQAAREGTVCLRGRGHFITDGETLVLQYRDGYFSPISQPTRRYDPDTLLAMARDGEFVGVFTADLGRNVDWSQPQPAIWSRGPIQSQRGRQVFPSLTAQNPQMAISGRHILPDARIFVNGRPAAGEIDCQSISTYDCNLTISLDRLPPTGMHFLQVQNPDGLFSNDYIFYSQGMVDLTQRWLPHVTAGEGSFITALTLTNMSDRSQTVLLQPYTLDGEPLPPQSLAIPAGGFFQGEIAAVFPTAAVSHLSLSASDQVVLTAAYRAKTAQGSTAHVQEAVRIGRSFTIYADDWRDSWDGMALVNLGLANSEIRLIHRDGAGQILRSVTLDQNLAAYAKVRAVFGDHLENVPGSRITVESDEDAVVVFLRGDLGADPQALYPTLPLPSKIDDGIRMIEHVTPADGAFESRLYFTNQGSTPADLDLQPYDVTGQVLTPSQVTVAAGETITASAATVFPNQAVAYFAIAGPSDCVVTVGYRANDERSTAHVNETSIAGTGATRVLLYPGRWLQEFDGVAVINAGTHAAHIVATQQNPWGENLAEITLHDALAPGAKHLVVFDHLLHEQTKTRLALRADQPLRLVFLRGTKPGARHLYAVEPVVVD